MREVMDPEAYYLETEVVNALSLIGNEKENVVDGLVYLFKGNINSDLMKQMREFDNVLSEILNNKKFGDPESEKRLAFRRNFIEKAREKLANRLPEPDRTEYFKFEKQQRENLSQGRIDYDSYRSSVLGWIVKRPLQEGLKKALSGKNVAECREILVNLIKENGAYNNHYHLFYDDLQAKGKVQGIYQKFLGAAFAYVDSKPSVLKTSQEKYAEFVTAAKSRLLQALPESISKAHAQHVKVIDELLQKGFIEQAGYYESRDTYLLGLIAPVKDDRHPVRGAASSAFDESVLNAPHLEKIVTDALQKSIRSNNKKNDTLEALIMCWGGFVNSHHDDFSLQPVCEAKSAYLKTKNSTHANDQLMKFRVDGEFSVEARKQLVKQLPGNLRPSYDAHEKLLLDHLGKGHITQQTYWNGMVLFLNEHFRFPS
ncbi:hypothetical protein ABC383_02040 [Noviherbaspirillum sp. 1P10PC]|uniref:hypothetical protein n=1 Tax=Noviherbaspirillum sp. 1P10PC TaxID=3132292 RepID=UPI0039A05C48